MKAQWNGLEKTGNLVFNVDVRIKKDDGSWSVYKDAYLAKRSIKSLEGSMTVDLDKKGLINDIGFAANQFEALNDGKTDATDVKVRVTVKAPDGTKDEDVVSYTVTVHNEPSEVDVGGSLNTGIEA
nr:hypothetical protein [uncultured archaeon]